MVVVSAKGTMWPVVQGREGTFLVSTGVARMVSATCVQWVEAAHDLDGG